MKRITNLVAIAALATAIAAPVVAEGLVIPNLSYRTGPFAATGIPLMNGQHQHCAKAGKLIEAGRCLIYHALS